MNVYEENKLMREALEEIQKDRANAAWLPRQCLAAIGPAQQPGASGRILSPDFLNLTERLLCGEVQPARGELIAHIDAWHAAGVAAAVHDARLEAIRGNNCLEQERAEKAEAELEEWCHTNRIDELQRAHNDWMQSSRDWKARAEKAEAKAANWEQNSHGWQRQFKAAEAERGLGMREWKNAYDGYKKVEAERDEARRELEAIKKNDKTHMGWNVEFRNSTEKS